MGVNLFQFALCDAIGRHHVDDIAEWAKENFLREEITGEALFNGAEIPHVAFVF